jgi:hypothetical protein
MHIYYNNLTIKIDLKLKTITGFILNLKTYNLMFFSIFLENSKKSIYTAACIEISIVEESMLIVL